MMSKKRRQRGSRTHGGGSHKNRRGAGHRGGRGKAGSRKHEMHHYGPWAKHGFTQPEEAQDSVAEVRVQKIDEDAALLAAEDLAENDDGAYTIDARDVAEDGWEVDVVKVLGNGQVRQELHVTADAFSDSATELIEDAGGSTTVSERAQERAEREAEQAAEAEEASED
ncbi:uL15m family ribosomal protein [Halolamina litorea]|uniref:Large ribosomal subunit protein uL15 n=1 Tax=Halolamina litorea TaxID=1515593 RepID=A0ABD6BSW5_9EURY|nr:uL15m family ribosomal protein [Halolamina litorea]